MSDEHSFNQNQQQAIGLAGQAVNTVANFLSTVGLAAWANRVRPVKIEIKPEKPNPAMIPIPEAQGEQAGTELGMARQWLDAGVPLETVKDRIQDMNVAQRAKDPELAAGLLVNKVQQDMAFEMFGKEESPKAEKKARLVK
jgi:hypothetical protein